MLTQVCIECLTAKMPFSTKMWLEKLYRKRLITSALRKDLLQIDGVYARISKLKYELYHVRKRTDLNYVALGAVMACKDERQRLELEEKEKCYVDEVKRLKAIVVTVVETTLDEKLNLMIFALKTNLMSDLSTHQMSQM